jgi:hypothetical protein
MHARDDDSFQRGPYLFDDWEEDVLPNTAFVSKYW